MARSIFKLPYVHRSVFSRSIIRREQFFKNVADAKSTFGKLLVERRVNLPLHVFFWKRNSAISKGLSSKKICTYNGKLFVVLNPNKDLKGFKLGEFSVTRKLAKHPQKKKRQFKKVKPKINKLLIFSNY